MAFTYTVGNLKTDLTAALHGTTLNKVQSVNAIIQRAASTLLLEVDPQETIRINQLTSPIFNQVYDYALPTDLKGNAIIDIRPQANRTLLDRYLQEYNQAFDINKAFTLQPNFTIQFNKGQKSIRIDNNLLLSGIMLNSADTITGNGTWVASGGAENLTQNNLQFTNGVASSISFDTVAGGTTAVLTNSTMQSQDLSDGYLQAHQFLYSFLNPASSFTQIELRFGTDEDNYFKETFTTTQSGTAFENGWNLVDGDWADATVVGSPDSEDIGYLQVRWVYDASVVTDVCLNQIWSRLGVISEIEYYSKYMFQNASTGAFQETITADTNLINLDTETRNLLFLLTAAYCVQQIQGADALTFDANYFQSAYDRALLSYKGRYKSQLQKPRSTYYYTPNPSNQNWMNRRGY